jgi:hypothetical protein
VRNREDFTPQDQCSLYGLSIPKPNWEKQYLGIHFFDQNLPGIHRKKTKRTGCKFL